jgi:hypothetical protein
MTSEREQDAGPGFASSRMVEAPEVHLVGVFRRSG